MKDYGLSDGETPFSPEITLEDEDETLKFKAVLPIEWQTIPEFDTQYNENMPASLDFAQWFLTFIDFYAYLKMLTQPPKTIEFLCYPYLKGIYPKGTDLENGKRMLYYKACTNCHKKLITCPNDTELSDSRHRTDSNSVLIYILSTILHISLRQRTTIKFLHYTNRYFRKNFAMRCPLTNITNSLKTCHLKLWRKVSA